MRNKLLYGLVALIFLCGLGIMLYPTLADHWNARVQSRAVAVYQERELQLTEEDQTAALAAAAEYNQVVASLPVPLAMVTTEKYGYESLLNISGNGVMGYLEIQKINVRLSIYHGVDEAVLQVGMGHVLGSSLPVGGVGTHAALSGHTGLPSAKLLTDLDQLVQGDTFDIHVLGQVLRYEVDQILVVEPDDVSALAIDPEADQVTLITCTPYGINSHRLLVRGKRVEYVPETVAEEETPDQVVNDSARQVPEWEILAMVAALALLLRLFRRRRA